MAVKIYRYKQEVPISTDKLQRQAGNTASYVGNFAGQLIDVEIEETLLVDLDDTLAEVGYSRVADEPVYSLEKDYDDLPFEARSFSSGSTTTTNSSSFTTKVTLGPLSLEAGDYEITASFNWDIDSNTSRIETRITQNGSPLGQNQLGGRFQFGGGSVSPITYATKVYPVTLVNGTYTWLLQFRPNIGSPSTTMTDALLRVRKV